MSKIIIVYASMSGNTEEMADAVAAGIQEAGVTPVLKNVMDANASELENYEGVILGSYTWGDGDLPDEFEDFYDEMDDINLEGRKFGVFGSADSSYAEFGAAVDTLEKKLAELGAEKVFDGLKVELNPSKDEKELCRQLGLKFAAALGVSI
ncbi:flavodoxin [Paenibacillus pectinilyticus]|uniref:Flavodoxin n=1 Tax=Paenibacillus pectinilyticus TaxID=512399 RepID=A0A1C0ZT06_9BACL|nr:flavodoxin [Paenibacillus pectinilyticus]OCT11191.1 flavodoxin [Paenibacillus pectinilyticus]